MADQCASQIEAPVGARLGVRLDLLGQQFAEDDLLGEIFRAGDDVARAALAAACEGEDAAAQEAEGVAAVEGYVGHLLRSAKNFRRFYLSLALIDKSPKNTRQQERPEKPYLCTKRKGRPPETRRRTLAPRTFLRIGHKQEL